MIANNSEFKTEERPFRVLSLDGGGIRGLYTASFLNCLSKRFEPNNDLDVGKAFDLIVGTSTGAILSCGLAYGVPLKKIIELYRKDGKFIFKNPVPHSKMFKFLWTVKNLFYSANENVSLKRSLENVFGETTIKEIYENRKIALCVNAVNLLTSCPRVFKTAHVKEKHADDYRKLVDICLASSAAPIILPIANIPNPEDEFVIEQFVDGGLWANNPILVSLVESLILATKDQPIEILSIGTCPSPPGQTVNQKSKNNGIWYWELGTKALAMSMDAQAMGVNFIAQFLSQTLTDLGKDIKILRLKSTPPSINQAKYLSMDNASEESCSILTQLGSHDAKIIYGECLKKDSEMELIKNIFTNTKIMGV